MTSSNQKKEKTTEEVKPVVAKKDRRERVSMTESRSKLKTNVKKQVEDNYYLRWFNDVGSRIQDALNASYEFVNAKEIEGRVGDKEVHGDNSDLNSRVSKKTKVGDDEITVFLMKLPNDLKAEDDAVKAAKNDMVDDSIRAGTSGGASIGNQYGEVKMR